MPDEAPADAFTGAAAADGIPDEEPSGWFVCEAETESAAFEPDAGCVAVGVPEEAVLENLNSAAAAAETTDKTLDCLDGVCETLDAAALARFTGAAAAAGPADETLDCLSSDCCMTEAEPTVG